MFWLKANSIFKVEWRKENRYFLANRIRYREYVALHSIRFKRTKPVEACIVCTTMCVKIGSYCCVFIAPFHARKHSPFPPLPPPPPSPSSSPHYRKHRGVWALVTSTFTDNNHTARRWKRKPNTYSGFCCRRNGIAASCYCNGHVPVDIGFVCLFNALFYSSIYSEMRLLWLNILTVMILV